jgi:hypothetical protein
VTKSVTNQSNRAGSVWHQPPMDDRPGFYIDQYRTSESAGHWTHTLNCTPHLVERIIWTTSQIG